LPSSVHAWWEDTCAVWSHNSTILGWAALGEAEKTMEQNSRLAITKLILGRLWPIGYHQIEAIDIPDWKFITFLDRVDIGPLSGPLNTNLIGSLWGPHDLTYGDIELCGMTRYDTNPTCRLGLILGGALFYARVTFETLVVFIFKVPTLAACGLEERRNLEELLTESVGCVHFS
jgi:hypothetical protein